MLHHPVSPATSDRTLATSTSTQTGLSLVRAAARPGSHLRPASVRAELLTIAARRSASFFAEAAVLVLVFGILDIFLLKGKVELSWVAGALGLSVGLLAASIAMDFSAHRWMKAHP